MWGLTIIWAISKQIMQRPIRALALMGHSELGISLERLLQEVGLQNPLNGHYKEDSFRCHLTKGQQDRITGIGLKK